LFPKTVVFPALQLHLLLDVVVPGFNHAVLRLKMDDLVVALLENPLDAVDFLFPFINFRLLLLEGDLGLFVDFLLLRGNPIQLLSHVLDLFGLRVVDVSLTSNLLVALLDLFSCFFVLFSHFPLCLLRFGKLDFNIAEGVLQFLVLKLTEP